MSSLTLRSISPGETVFERNPSFGVSVETINLSVDVPVGGFVSRYIHKQTKRILNDVSVKFRPGLVHAIMGPSGSGKSTLLNAIAGRLRGTAHVEGTVCFNGSPKKPAEALRKFGGYVLQEDHLPEYLTVEELLTDAARLRLPRHSAAQRATAVRHVISTLGLVEVRQSLIGGPSKRGISGGERRRLSIAVQLLTEPSVLLLDEPTSGLDSASALCLGKTLQTLAADGRTIIISIHQPRSALFRLTDWVKLLSGGDVLYDGPTSEVVPWCASLGYPCPATVNPADHIIDLVAIDSRTEDSETASRARLAKLRAVSQYKPLSGFVESPERTTASFSILSDSPGPTGSKNSAVLLPSASDRQASVFVQYGVLTQRHWRCEFRDPLGIFGQAVLAIGYGSFMGLVFFRLSDDNYIDVVVARRSALYMIGTGIQYQFIIFQLRQVCSDIVIYDRERTDSMYGVGPFLLGYLTARLPVVAFFGCIYGLIMYNMIGLRTDDYFTHLSFMMVGCVNVFLAASAIAWLCVAISRRFDIESLIANSLVSFQSNTSGFLFNVASIPVYLKWIIPLSPFHWSFYALCCNEFYGSTYGDSPYNGTYILQTLDLTCEGSGWDSYRLQLYLLAYVVGCYFLTYILLHLFPRYPALRDAVPTGVEVSSSVDSSRYLSPTDVPSNDSKGSPVPRGISVTLHNVSLTLPQKKRRTSSEPFDEESVRLIPQAARKNTILKGINLTIHPGSVVMLLGASGSGKSTLLSAIGGRIASSLTPSGTMTFDGARRRIRAPQRSRDIAFVPQDDALSAALTVSECVYEAAALRGADGNRVEAVITALGLKSCRDNLVARCSGGERRRVSVAMQLVGSPRLLLLDEPTTGLDSSAAKLVVERMRYVASQTGCTVVASIHQPRSDLWDLFDDVVLLAGGRVAYAGPTTSILDYFEKAGVPCPRHTSVADHALDATVVSYASPQEEEESRDLRDHLCDFFSREPMDLPDSPRPGSPVYRSVNVGHPVSWWTVTFIVTSRFWRTLSRDPRNFVVRIAQCLAFALIMTMFAAPIKNDENAVMNITGLLYQMSSLTYVGMLNNLAVFPAERDTFFREWRDGLVGLSSFMIAYTTCELPAILSGSLIVGCLCSGVSEMLPWSDFPRILLFCVPLACNLSIGESIGITVNAFLRHIGLAVSIINIVIGFAAVMCGLLTVHMVQPLRALNYISPLRASTGVLASLAFDRDFCQLPVNVTCFPSEDNAVGGCPVGLCSVQGKRVLEQSFNIHYHDRYLYLGIALGAVVVIRGFAIFCLYAILITRTRLGWGG